MGHYSFNCNHCTRPIHDKGTTWRGLNEWMTSAVVLMANGSRVMGEYDGYGNVGHMNAAEACEVEDAVWVHRACWTHAGKPEFEEYSRPSRGCQHGGYDEKDLIPEPGTTPDPAAWAEALAQRTADIRANEVREAMGCLSKPRHHATGGEQVEEPWKRRFQTYHFDGKHPIDPKNPDPAGWRWYDSNPSWGGYEGADHEYGLATEEEAKAECKKRWSAWLDSPELAQMKVERKAALDVRGEESKANCLNTGAARFETSKYGPKVEGTENRWYVYDRCDYSKEDTELYDDNYLLAGATEAEAKVHADKLNHEFFGSQDWGYDRD